MMTDKSLLPIEDVTQKLAENGPVDMTGSYMLSPYECFCPGGIVQPPGYTFKITGVRPMGQHESHPYGHAVACWLESDIARVLICMDGIVIGHVKADLSGEFYTGTNVNGTNGNFGGPGQLAGPPEMEDLAHPPFNVATVWTCVVTLVNDNQIGVVWSNDDPLYAGVTWEVATTPARTNWFAQTGSGVSAWHGAVDREWVKRLSDIGYNNNSSRDGIMSLGGGVRVFGIVM